MHTANSEGSGVGWWGAPRRPAGATGPTTFMTDFRTGSRRIAGVNGGVAAAGRSVGVISRPSYLGGWPKVGAESGGGGQGRNIEAGTQKRLDSGVKPREEARWGWAAPNAGKLGASVGGLVDRANDPRILLLGGARVPYAVKGPAQPRGAVVGSPRSSYLHPFPPSVSGRGRPRRGTRGTKS